MKRINHIASQCASLENKLYSWHEMQKHGGRRSPEINEYGRNIELNIRRQITRDMEGLPPDIYYETFPVADPKPRLVDAPCVDARFSQKSLLVPIKDRIFKKMCPSSYGGIPGKGPLKACWKIMDFINSYPPDVPISYLHYDFRNCYGSVDHDVIKSHVNTFVKDRWWMTQFSYNVDSYRNRTTGKGVPLGAETSKDGVNMMFTELDRHLYYRLKLKNVRYCDDGVVISDSMEVLNEVLSFIVEYARNNLHMELHPVKTMIGDARKGIDCFGYIITPDGLRPRKRNVRHALHRIKKLRKDADQAFEAGNQTLGYQLLQTLRSSLVSFLGYMKWCRWSKWAQQVVDASGLWDANKLKQKIIKPKEVRDRLAWQHREEKRKRKANLISQS